MINQLIKRLKRYNEWRRGGDFEQPPPTELGQDIDSAINILGYNDRLLTLATKYCPTDHHDWDEILEIAEKCYPNIKQL